ncbi:hypothetical protein DYBT9623_04461 [Dyadobacter sp. CECT 9623]|uniref:Uncharacterized protein n=1 Tax=Dyadobacter linearis TaxID=2823330 RepID=A0ABN7RJR0_9BACT|nr:hypothetical protein [Dyadobacter sp. CECT 9623]CAG5072924.1 hypothetical protein DYBT9623_04461 [Dyadobacter sp. CECT 9623]
MNGYDLSRQWFDFAFERQECKVQHTALYLWIVELNNRLGWKSTFGLPMSATMEGLSIGNKTTYSNTLRDLVSWGFIEIVQEAKNQYQSCIVKLCWCENEQALSMALSTALYRHSDQHRTGIVSGTELGIESSTVTIDKPLNFQTFKPLNKETIDADRVEILESLKDRLLDEEKNASPKVPRKGSPKFDPAKIELPFSGEGFSIAWLAWIKHRQEIKKPLTETAVGQQLKKLSSFDEATATALILQTVEKGWHGIVYELRSENHWQPNAPAGKGNIQKNYESVMTAEQRILQKRGLN